MRENFGSKFGALMALAGSSIGLGNMWRFPYTVGVYGGAAFIILYLILTFVICLPMLNTEILLGRRAQANTFGAFKKMAPGSQWKWLGLIMSLTPLVVVSYYSVVGGWAVEYFFKSLCFDFTAAGVTHESLGGMFGGFISSVWGPLVCHIIFLVLTSIIVLGGVQKGIERFGKIMMPVLFVIILLIVVRSSTLPGAWEGYKFLFKPDFSKITPAVVIAALGQAFFSLSIAAGAIFIYASYLRPQDNVGKTAMTMVVADVSFALIAGCAIMPAVFACNLSPEAGPGLIFQTLPFIFSQMPLGGVIALLFFIALLIASLTSSISMLEAPVAMIAEEWGWSRKKSIVIMFIVAWVVGVFCSLSFGPLSEVKLFSNTIFDFCDKLAANILMPLGALAMVIFVGWRMKRSEVYAEFTNHGALSDKPLFGFRRSGLGSGVSSDGSSCGSRLTWFSLMYFIIRYIGPIAIIVIMITGLVG